ncbi:Rhodanese-related sulfurtransferase [Friedmanniomyces endolithicus]|uniref:Ribosome biogenesis regulatory protein n=1 Tax=Friedmanniomyces endolithicus TaxID=329885 RepID=A0AAN6H7Y8_9PEZI|nr:Rhodanese- sulfurtransferase [Friedmanniomyces endolithicus]KAK0282889.1 Rhodanese- sulfurtransferase [Friedmanniomyces endolithicus]KAK0320735.1 Rhodanese- sulfurtransferase [Friedmanniomyces endolithicus]KAK0928140.1 Rhodanese-related sulfurtransferase [Friedmanniomyces endolithicus]KAK0955998.1 Rhodanese-related sulfurtransferase [Friedmanniomyces endolithicus]
MADPQPQVQPYAFDLGHLLLSDPNPLTTAPTTASPTDKEALLAARAQLCAQALINQLLTACSIQRSPEGDLHIKLPDPTTQLPREKPVPKEKEKTKWDKFAEKKGIKAKRKDGKLAFDEVSGEWKAKYGYQGKASAGAAAGGVGEDWLVEVDEKAEKAEREGADGGKKAKKQKKGRTTQDSRAD